MGIGIVSYYAPPINLPPSLRLLRTVRSLQFIDRNVYLFSSDSQIKGANVDNLLYKELPNDIIKERILSPSVYSLHSILGKKIAGRIEDKFYHYIDNAYCWLPFLYRRLSLYIERGKIDKLFFSVSPFSSLLVIPKLKNKYPFVKIWVEFRDPWIGNVYNPQYDKYEELSKNLMEYTDIIFGSSKTITKLLKEQYKRDIFTLYSAEYKPKFLYNNIKIKHPAIVYTGRLYGSRRILPVLKIFDREWERGKDFYLYIIGNTSVYSEEEMLFMKKWKKYIELLPPMNWHNTMSYLKVSDILLLINGTKKGAEMFIPAKFYDYLFSKKPILLFDNGGELSDIIKYNKLGIVCNYNNCEVDINTVLSYKNNNENLFTIENMVKTLRMML